MTPDRSPDIRGSRSVLLAIFAACCVLAFGAAPHSSTDGLPANVPAGNGAVVVAQSVLHTDSPLLTRSVAVPGMAPHVAMPSVDVAFFAVALLLTGGWLLRLRRRRHRADARWCAPGPARAPPLAG